eukprot:gene37185-48595_t
MGREFHAGYLEHCRKLATIQIQRIYRGWLGRKRAVLNAQEVYVKCVDADAGHPYWFNNVTEASFWRKPKLLREFDCGEAVLMPPSNELCTAPCQGDECARAHTPYTAKAGERLTKSFTSLIVPNVASNLQRDIADLVGTITATVVSNGYIEKEDYGYTLPHGICFENVFGLQDPLQMDNVFPVQYLGPAVKVLSRSHLRMKVWERGAGPTLACGTGACAVVVSAVLSNRADRKCTVSLPGGDLFITWDEKDNHIYMQGPAKLVFSGQIDRQSL